MADGRAQLPTFVIIGAMKCGTTSLHHYLGMHPDVFVSDPKELDFFSHDAHFGRGLDWYRGHFDTDRPVRGEGSPNYLKRHLFPEAPARLAEVLPDARLLCLVRHPVARLVSHYVHAVVAGREGRSLNAVLDAGDAHAANLVETGLYSWQLEPWLERFGRDRFWFATAEDLAADNTGTVRAALAFVGADPEQYVNGTAVRFNTGAQKTAAPAGLRSRLRARLRPRTPRPELRAGVRATLMERYEPDIRALEQLLGRPLDWS